MLKTITAIRPHKIPKKINPKASFVPPKNKTIGNPKAETVKVPKEAPFPAGLRNESKTNKDDLSLSSDKNEKENSSDVGGTEVEN